ncbi:hypothetical protein LCGC14_0395150 [marine sediment metagenome]|uniref:Uncharacterized protein n=1 Tax=marine sediment metagenome TaxID=412755 RepID=A0A0F9SYB9_9ZZZZ
MAITILNKFALGSFIYLKTDAEQLKRQVTAVKIYTDGSYQYEVISGIIYSYHFECEMSKTREIVEETIGE